MIFKFSCFENLGYIKHQAKAGEGSKERLRKRGPAAEFSKDKKTKGVKETKYSIKLISGSCETRWLKQCTRALWYSITKHPKTQGN
jgi:hypothetical protein